MSSSGVSQADYSFRITAGFQAKPSQAKPSQAKVLTRGGDLREAQVFVPPVCLPFLLLTALLGTVTDFLTLMGNMLTLTFLKSG